MSVLCAAVIACGGASRQDFTARPDSTASQWAIAIDGSGSISGLAIAPDKTGGVVVAGGFDKKLSIGSVSLSSAGQQDAFVAALTAKGEPAWALSFGGKGPDRAAAIAVSGSGTTYVAGEFSGTALFVGEARTSVGASDGFVAAIDDNGTLRWVLQLPGPAYISPTQIAASDADEVVVSGYFTGSFEVADTVLRSGGALDAFVIAIDKRGLAAWARRAGGLGADMAHAVAIAPSGEIAIGGSFTDEADLLGLPLVARTGDVDGFVAVLSSAGVPVWAHSFGGTGADAVHSLDFDEAGNLYAAGSFSQSIDFGSGSRLDTAGRRDGFVVKLSLAGDAMWSSGLGGGGTDRANRVAAGDEVVLVAGTFEDRAALGDNTIKSRGRHDVFVAKLSERGVPMWLRNLGGIEEDAIGDLAVASDKAIGVIGSFVTSATVGGRKLDASASPATFVAKLAP